ncbi:Radical SAM superfamily enzyme, MoaA/NifB/PqqE/SkfB family [Amycolatopsis pretoriensis]|uniref:Radical SAM superfamily enzyme, MoaA/NifB/PqqE/SkfB family n=1 Tax=Amycolatopsis pretoriensis TaxID=218821 RepID=A0A1H5QFU6_9PSEU|nr:Radical SAM superfamily enzyme, MoaA/NifB/PqqE/SkfB family [Amycolatopsis pretoriensis]
MTPRLPRPEDIAAAVDDARGLGEGTQDPHVRAALSADIARSLAPGGSTFAPPQVWNARHFPVSVDDVGIVVSVDADNPGSLVGCAVVGPGRFVGGDDNDAFGRWNRLVAWLPRVGEHRIIRGHGGEIVPGRLADLVDASRALAVHGIRRPVQLDLDISMACTSACTFCFSASYRTATRSTRQMRPSAIDRVISSATRMGVKLVRFDGGGDPLTHPYFPRAVETCAAHSLRTAVLTAGDLLSPEIVDVLVESGTYLRVSLNAGTDETRSLLHGTNAGRFGLSRILNQIAYADRQRRVRYRDLPRPAMMIGATSMIHPLSVGEVFRTAERARSAGADHLSFRVVLGAGHSVSFSERQNDSYAEQRHRVLDELVDENFQVFFPTRPLTDTGYVPAQHFTTCRACTHRALVETGADPAAPALVPCGRYRGEGYLSSSLDDGRTVFDILDQERGLDEVWMSSRMRNMVQQFPRACGDCIDRSVNQMLEGIDSALTADPEAAFFRFQALDVPSIISGLG